MGFWDQLGAVVFDMDGVMFIGKRLRAGIRQLVGRLNDSGIDYHVLTNTGAYSRAEIASNLAEMGLDVPAGRITTSSELSATYVAERTGAKTVFTLGGGTGLSEAITAREMRRLALERLSLEDVEKICRAPGEDRLPLIVGWTRDYDHELATKALRLEEKISAMYVTGEDRCYAAEDGLLPGVLWLSASVAALIQKEPINPSKPNRYALEYVLGRLAQPPERVVVIGDSRSDIQAGNEAGCRTILVLGGATRHEQLATLKGIALPWQVIEELTDLL